jgi:transposase-like protein
MAPPSRYPQEFRRQAVALALDSGRPVRDVAKEPEVNHETLRNGVTKAKQERAGATPGGLSSDQRARRLTTELHERGHRWNRKAVLRSVISGVWLLPEAPDRDLSESRPGLLGCRSHWWRGKPDGAA